jgi:uncharacterized protein YndB with AHSA1/START domain
MTQPAIHSATQSVVMEREMPHPPEKVWRALTQGPLIEDWLMANDFEPVVGHRFTLRTQPVAHWDGTVQGEVLEVEPPESLAYRWDVGPEGGLRTEVRWTLTPTPVGVLVRMEQSGFREDQAANLQGATFGWRKFMAGLAMTVDKL